MNKSKTLAIEIAQKKNELKRGQAVLEIHVKRERKAAHSAYINANVTGTLTIKGHAFRHADGNILGLIAFVCGVRSVHVYSKNAEPGTMARASFFHPSLLRPWLSNGDEGRYLSRFGNGLHSATKSRNETRQFVDWWEAEKLPVALAEVPTEFRVHTQLERGMYDREGDIIKPAEIQRSGLAYELRSMLANLGRREEACVTVGNVTYVSQRAFITHRLG